MSCFYVKILQDTVHNVDAALGTDDKIQWLLPLGQNGIVQRYLKRKNGIKQSQKTIDYRRLRGYY